MATFALSALTARCRSPKSPRFPSATPERLRGAGSYTPDMATYPNGTHICEIEIDPETGAARSLRYTVVDDFGFTLNPLLLEGQVHGGIAQGIGQALMENAVYDSDGQLLSASLMDYCLPRADNFPPIAFETRNVPSTTNPMGLKGRRRSWLDRIDPGGGQCRRRRPLARLWRLRHRYAGDPAGDLPRHPQGGNRKESFRVNKYDPKSVCAPLRGFRSFGAPCRRHGGSGRTNRPIRLQLKEATMRKLSVFVAMFVLGASAALAMSGADAIKARRDLMKADGAATKPVVAMLQGKAPFDLATVQKALKTYENAMSKEPTLFPPDSKTGDTNALPVIWDDDNMADLDARFKKFGDDATAALATIKDEASFKATMPGVLKNCGDCHEKYHAKRQ